MTQTKEKIDIKAEDYVNSYQNWVDTQVWPSVAGDDDWAVMGLLSEAGEVAQLREKFIRKGAYTADQYQFEMKSELGDILWNIANLCNLNDLTLHEVLMFNIQKIEERKLMALALANKEKAFISATLALGGEEQLELDLPNGSNPKEG